MPHPSASLLEISGHTNLQIEALFSSAVELSKNIGATRSLSRTAALLFFEPSTRTRFSFETACAREGLHPLLLEGGFGTSLEKGESIEDTILNIAAMEPEVVVLRCGDAVDLMDLQAKIKIPILNAGWGSKGHPTQALLDALTMKMSGRDLAKEKLLVVGDVKHSRVISSHFELANVLGYEIGICAPKEFLPLDYSGRHFLTLKSGLEWATSIMALRVQHERHGQRYSMEAYCENYGLSLQKLKSWDSDGLLLHPGPVNYGVELNANVNQDSRCKIFEQVRWGVYLRQALLARVLAERKVR